MNIEKIAMICHEVTRVFCKSCGDYSQVSWNDAPDWQRQLAIQKVKFLIENPKATPEDSHESWRKLKKSEGWVYGEIKNTNKKIHPRLMAYKYLPESQKLKDEFFLTIVRLLVEENNE